jgi:transcriptional regulator with XRE-family HTH domain
MPRDNVIGLGRRIQARRLDKNLKQAALARQAGIAPSYLSELETKEGACPSAIVLYRIGVALDASVPALLGMPELPAPPPDGRGIPPTLQRARAVYRMADDEVALLRGLEYRGQRPRTEEDWFFLLCAIKRAVERG